MSTHTIAEATTALPRLIDRALNGETILIARDGQPVAELRPIRAEALTGRPSPQDMLAWLDAHRVGDHPPAADAATRVRQMRDEGA